MGLTYDIDMQRGAAGAADHALATFRNPATAEALRGADERVRAVFREAGFGFLPSGGTLSEGTHDRTQTAEFDGALSRLLDAREATDLERANWNGFDPGIFLFTALRSVAVDPENPPLRDVAPVDVPEEPTTAPEQSILDAHIPMHYILIGLLLVGIIVYEVFLVPPGAESLIDVLQKVLSFEPQSM